MQFQLPSALQQELLAYDPKLKALVKEQAPKKAGAKPKFPLGNIPCLIPTHIVREALQKDAIAEINASAAPDRFHRFTKVINVASADARVVTVAILCHYEQCWYAAWLPGKDDDDYIYGYAHAFKDTATTAKVIDRQIWLNREHYKQHEMGRNSVIYSKAFLVTKDDIVNGNDKRNWRPYGLASYPQKGLNISEMINEFERRLQETIPCWNDTRSMFDRMKCKSIWDTLDVPRDVFSSVPDKSKFELSVENFIKLSYSGRYNPGYFTHTTYSVGYKIKDIITKPVIRKRLQSCLDRAVATYNDPENEYQKHIRYGYKEFEKTMDAIYTVHTIWPDCPIDYYNNYYEELRTLQVEHLLRYLRNDAQVIQWLREYMPVASFFNLLRKYKESFVSQARYHRLSSYSDYDYPTHTLHELADTFSMIGRLLENGKTVEPPKRWRMPDFHDYVQAEAWKIQNPNTKLHQDLFPEPVKVTVDDETWTFLQPMDTHQLSAWGQAVRNCVGSSSQYADNIKKRKHFIVLCMIAGKPTFTIQMDVSMGVMNVKQIAGVSNQRLSQEEQDKYSDAFKQALQQREKQLVSA